MRGAVLSRRRLALRARQAPDVSLERRTHRAGARSQRRETSESRVGRVSTRLRVSMADSLRFSRPGAERRGNRRSPLLDEAGVVRVREELPYEGVTFLAQARQGIAHGDGRTTGILVARDIDQSHVGALDESCVARLVMIGLIVG